MRGDRRHRRIGEIVGRHIHRLDRGDRGAADRGDAFLQSRHLARQRGLVADTRRQTAQQAGDLGARLHETEDIIHEQQHVLVLFIAKIFGDGQRGQRHPPARAGRLVHLTINQHSVTQHAEPRHVEQHFVTFAGSLTDSGEDRNALIADDHGVDQFHHQHGLAYTGAAEHCRLATLCQRRQQVDDLDPRGEQLRCSGPRRQRRRSTMDRPARHIVGQRGAVVADAAGDVDQAAEHSVADRDGDRTTGWCRDVASAQARGGVQRDGADGEAVQMRLDLGHDRAAIIRLKRNRVVDRRQHAGGEREVDHRTTHRDHLAIVQPGCTHSRSPRPLVMPVAARRGIDPGQ